MNKVLEFRFTSGGEAIDPELIAKNPLYRNSYFEEYADLVSSRIVLHARKHAGFTQKQLAQAIGVTQSRISKMESSPLEGELKLSTLFRVAEACGVELEVGLSPRNSSQICEAQGGGR